ncbi:PTS sugar transporter subunit IIB [Clostridium sp. NSJ-6]|uniref:PTS sugar transporter subunit IIB n=1 Tax=Clostridium hominis TaxID=2763036 RepID=A0ABR7DAB3_9CLOT|nr:PTS sugar transporter subunit IIB [Clostridium hominis]MBC5628334.1 PTS sugar transporter subunit IIB [Clostridium hominis]MDU2670976.1 PTS sugar transporter subunit IIB [Clostridium sp.]
MKIILVCSIGMSSGELVKKMKRISDERKLDLDIKGIGYTDIIDEIDGADVILLGPQVKYLLRKVVEIAEPMDIPVEIINHLTYGMRNAEKVIDFAINIIKK